MSTLTNVVRDKSVAASASAGVVLAAGATIAEVPWWLWAAWAVVAVVGCNDAFAHRHDTDH